MSLFSTKEESILLNGVGSNNTKNMANNSDTNNNNHNEDDLLLVNDDETWQVYEGIMRQVMAANRVLKKDKLESMKPVHDFILSNHPARLAMPVAPTTGSSSSSSISSSSTQGQQETSTVVDDDAMVVKDNGNSNNNSSTITSSATTTTMRAQLNLQRRMFMETYQWTQVQYDYAVRCFTYMGDFCAKNQTTTTRGGGGGGGNPIVVAWHKLKECGMIPKENCISTYMYVLSLKDEDKHANNDDDDNNNSASSVLMEVATFHDLLFPPNEKTVTLRIKSLIAQGNVQEAEAILQSLPVSV
jgi:hypothetical protein